MPKVLILASGGLDSTVLINLYHNLGYEIRVLYFDYGNINAKPEFAKLEKALYNIGVSSVTNLVKYKIDFRFSKGGCLNKNNPDIYVEMRNLIFLSYALGIAQRDSIETVAVGFIKVPQPYVDSSEQFLFDMNNMSLNSVGVQIEAPLIHLDKLGVYKLGEKFGVKLKDTYSCNVSGTTPCGVCLDCKDTRELIRDAEIPDDDNPFK